MLKTLLPRRRFAALALCAAAWLSAGPSFALTDADGAAARTVVEELARDLGDLAERTAGMSRADAVDASASLLTSSFDLDRIAAATVGRTRYESWTPEQRATYVEAFTRYTLATQTGSLTRYEQDRLTIGEAVDGPAGLVMVRTQYQEGDGGTSTVDFMLHKDGSGAFRIVDLVVDGSVSQLQLRRAEFSSVLQSKGYDGLIEVLNETTQKILAKSG
ncbi:MAG: ABC transporter substrate-binding protein [Alphaproteobacteria bacterium]|nr:ABC transporter substrate-binding protein [Alphaproteobacteria bacterium]